MCSPPPLLELDGLVLRRKRVADAELIAGAVAANLHHLRPWMPWADERSGDVAFQRERLVAVERTWDEGTELVYLMLDRSQVRLLGVIGLHRRVGPGAIELGYWLAEDAVGNGHVTAAARALTELALQLDDVTRVEIRCDEANSRSRAVPARLGYRLDRVEVDGVEAPAELGRSMVWVYPPLAVQRCSVAYRSTNLR